jgi:hypothetical protein
MKRLVVCAVLCCGFVPFVNVRAQSCGLKPVQLPPVGLTNPVLGCSCKSYSLGCEWVWVSSDQQGTRVNPLNASILNSLANFDPGRSAAETQLAEQRVKLLRQQTELLRQQSEALRLANEKGRRAEIDDASRREPQHQVPEYLTNPSVTSDEQQLALCRTYQSGEKSRERVLGDQAATGPRPRLGDFVTKLRPLQKTYIEEYVNAVIAWHDRAYTRPN